jgi:hypothetical protein
VGYRIQIGCAVGAVSATVLTHARERMRELAATLELVPQSSAFWLSIRESSLFVDVEGWRFTLAVNQERQLLIVASVTKVPGSESTLRQRANRNRS